MTASKTTSMVNQSHDNWNDKSDDQWDLQSTLNGGTPHDNSKFNLNTQFQNLRDNLDDTANA